MILDFFTVLPRVTVSDKLVSLYSMSITVIDALPSRRAIDLPSEHGALFRRRCLSVNGAPVTKAERGRRREGWRTF